MSHIFLDVDAFIKAVGHEPGPDRIPLYLELVREEVGELEEGMAGYFASETDTEKQIHRAEVVDAICDTIWVLIGLGRMMNLPLEEAWDEVAITNFKKIDPELGRVMKDENGKVMKPSGWREPNMLRIVKQFDERKQTLAAPEIQE